MDREEILKKAYSSKPAAVSAWGSECWSAWFS